MTQRSAVTKFVIPAKAGNRAEYGHGEAVTELFLSTRYKFRGAKILKKLFFYIRDVRAEWFKIVWANRETVIRSVILIFIFAGLFALFLFFVDSIMSTIVGWIF